VVSAGHAAAALSAVALSAVAVALLSPLQPAARRPASTAAKSVRRAGRERRWVLRNIMNPAVKGMKNVVQHKV
jgi:hypothetical protein